MISQAVGDELRFDTRRIEGFWIAQQLEAPEESRTANIADQRKLHRASGHDGRDHSVLAWRLDSEDDLPWAIYRPDVGERLGLADPAAALDAALAFGRYVSAHQHHSL